MKTPVFACTLGFLLAVPALAAAQDLQPPGGPPPPGVMVQQPAQPPTDEAQDSGIGLEWVYLNAEAGTSYVDMKAFDQSQLAVVDTSKSGGMFGFGAGARLLFLSLGARARYHTAMNLWQINAEVGFHMKFGRLDPYLLVRGGYDVVGSFNQSVSVASGSDVPASVDVHGWNGGAAFGLDYYLHKLFSIGAEVSGDVLFLKRPPAPLPSQFSLLPPDQQASVRANPLYQQSGSSIGFGATLSAHVGLHF